MVGTPGIAYGSQLVLIGGIGLQPGMVVLGSSPVSSNETASSAVRTTNLNMVSPALRLQTSKPFSLFELSVQLRNIVE